MKEKIMLLRMAVNNMLITVAALEPNKETREEDLYTIACLRQHLIEAESYIVKLDNKHPNIINVKIDPDTMDDLKTIDKGIEILKKWQKKTP